MDKKNIENFLYKRLKPEDLELLQKLNEVFAVEFADPETHLAHPPNEKYLFDLLGKEHFVAQVALHKNEVVGGLIAYVLDKYEQQRSEIYIYDLAVAEKYRRKGIARNLINELKSFGRSIGAWVIIVQADRVDEPAVKLYQSMGVQEEPLHFDISIS